MGDSRVSDFQSEVARTFFALPEAESFLLAGGLALAAHGFLDRATEDLDAFTARTDAVRSARDAFIHAARGKGWTIEERQSSDSFVRLVVTGPESMLVDIGLDSAPELPATMSALGPTFAPLELAGRKLLALFDRAMPRDFVDVYRLSKSWNVDEMITLAETVDSGFDMTHLAISLTQLDHIRDEDLPIALEQIGPLREFFREWRSSITG